MKRTFALVAFAICTIFSLNLKAAEPAEESLELQMAQAANDFLEALEPPMVSRVSYPFDEERKNWHFIPRERQALSLGEMTPEQEELLFQLLAKGLSAQGLQTVRDVIGLEEVLAVLEGEGRRFPRSRELYHIWIFGTPGGHSWGWRFEGHHLSINATIVAGEGISMTPTFVGANPAEVPSGDRKGFRALPDEEDLALSLVNSFSDEQLERAVFEATSPRDIFSAVKRKISPLPVEGIRGSDLNAVQLGTLKQLVDVFLRKNRDCLYQEALAVVERDGWEAVSFGWAGGLTKADGNYYFVQGASFLIEYDNTQNKNNHIHSVWREFDGDFGEDMLMKHHHAHAH